MITEASVQGPYCDAEVGTFEAGRAPYGAVIGWAWADTYVFRSSHVVTSVVLNYNTNYYKQWYVMAYNDPEAGIEQVKGGRYSATWVTPRYMAEADSYPYYFYY